ncbi:MAG: phenylalanine--tRNA ligase subunit alpha [Candidatus Omnitrophica bacterium]|nr:phenylalanine--tRNA ligase subunit alpha [Candidatus Omnitrophota bacterium]
MVEKIKKIQQDFEKDIQAATSPESLEEMRIKYIGRKSELAAISKMFPTLSSEEKAQAGQILNVCKKTIEQELDKKKTEIQKTSTSKDAIDVTIDAIKKNIGSLHPLTKTMDAIVEIFMSLGYRVAEGNEIETEFANFEGLNIPLDHPARDDFDTFYVDKDRLLRSHTSTVQIRVMEKQAPPIQMIMPGRVYRPDAVDATHSFMFHQVEGLMVNKNIRFSDLKGTLNIFAKQMFGDDVKLRFRPSFFPFTEPSAEIDVSCIMCKGKGCRVCSQTGWLEILGAGMVNPKVFKNVDYDPDKWTGFAFGMGVERIAMLKYGITDIRLFFENNKQFLSQF